MAQQPECPSEEKYTPQAQMPQEGHSEPSFRLVAAMLILAASLGMILIVGANCGESIRLQQEIRTVVVTHTLPLAGSPNILSGANLTTDSLTLDYAVEADHDNLIAITESNLPIERTPVPAGPVMSREMSGIRRVRIAD